MAVPSWGVRDNCDPGQARTRAQGGGEEDCAAEVRTRRGKEIGEGTAQAAVGVPVRLLAFGGAVGG